MRHLSKSKTVTMEARFQLFTAHGYRSCRTKFHFLATANHQCALREPCRIEDCQTLLSASSVLLYSPQKHARSKLSNRVTSSTFKGITNGSPYTIRDLQTGHSLKVQVEVSGSWMSHDAQVRRAAVSPKSRKRGSFWPMTPGESPILPSRKDVNKG